MPDLEQGVAIVNVAQVADAVIVAATELRADVACVEQRIDVETAEVLVVVAEAARNGRDGIDGDKTYRHIQALPSAAWTVEHNLNKFPAVSTVDSGGEEVIGEVVYDSANQCTVRFFAPFSGQAFCN